jgi:hypothetical protein
MIGVDYYGKDTNPFVMSSIDGIWMEPLVRCPDIRRLITIF